LQTFVNRCLAVRALGDFISVTLNENFPKPLASLTFHILKEVLLKAFPEDGLGQAGQGNYSLSNLMMLHVSIIKACSKMLACEEAQADLFQKYVDRLFTSLLSPKSLLIMKIATLQSINDYLPVSKMNRNRVDDNFKEPILLLSKFVFYPQDATGFNHDSYNMESSPNMIDKNSNLFNLLKLEISKFWNKWYARPTDEQLIQYHSKDEYYSKYQEGYQLRRYEFIQGLSQRSQAVGQRQARRHSAGGNKLTKVVEPLHINFFESHFTHEPKSKPLIVKSQEMGMFM
jgi:hypothetical protein